MNVKIAVIGLGYVGLPLAIEFAKKYDVTGFDIDENRIKQLLDGYDKTNEVESESILTLLSGNLKLTSTIQEIESCNFYIITVPTPIDKHKRPLLDPLVKASETIGSILKKGDIVVYESTVYPGVTEEVCVPILENISSLTYNQDFFVGYSPERINPGDKLHTVANILKITSGSTTDSADVIDEVYKSVITAGTFKASSIKVAEAAKVIENSQRDINIAFVNELSKIFNLMGVNTYEVLEAASTKWNFLKFYPGLVGGHCIGVDPYYLAQKSQELGYHPEIILAGRRINDSMGQYVASQVIKLMIKEDIKILNAKILVLGFSFKENCPDVRNTKVVDIVEELKSYGCQIDVFDPVADFEGANKEYGISLLKINPVGKYDAVVLAVAHDFFRTLHVKNFQDTKCIIYDVKGVLNKEIVTGSL